MSESECASPGLNLFLNELSIPTEPTLFADAEKLIRDLVKSLRKAKRLNNAVALQSRDSLAAIEIIEHGHGPLGAVIGARLREEWSFLGSLADRASPLGEDLMCDCKFNGEPARALGLAHQHDTIVSSLLSDSVWNESEVCVDIDKLKDDYEIATEVVRVRNISDESTVNHWRCWLEAYGQPDLSQAENLWKDRVDLWPGLRFLPRVEEDFKRCRHLDAVKKRLDAINGAIIIWRTSGHASPAYGVNVTPEHEMRKALCLAFDPITSTTRCFDTHARFTPGAGRIHFIEEGLGLERRGIVGYIGNKLWSPIPTG